MTPYLEAVLRGLVPCMPVGFQYFVYKFLLLKIFDPPENHMSKVATLTGEAISFISFIHKC